MAGVICLQGGRELTADCLEMDRLVLERVDGDVAVLAGAARPGSDYDGASQRTVIHYQRLGAQVRVVPDPRVDHASSRAALTDDLGLLVLPGGSPGGLLDVLDGEVGARVVELHRRGVVLSGASAGAMVLCELSARPDRGGGTAPGLGLVPGLVVPHWSPGSERRWPLPDGIVWGLPECGGAVIDGDDVVAVGKGRPSVRTGAGWTELRRDTPTSLTALGS